jgi:hypothetical protein
MLTYVFFSVLSIVTSNVAFLLGITYPVVKTWKAISADDQEAHKQWLTFWTIYSFLYVFETMTYWFLGYFWFYHEVKLVLILWLALPTYNGAQVVYDRVILKLLLRFEGEIDDTTDKLSPFLQKKGWEMFRRGSQFAIRRGTSYIEETQGDNADATIGMLKVLAKTTDAGKMVGKAMATAEEKEKEFAPKKAEAKKPASSVRPSKKGAKGGIGKGGPKPVDPPAPAPKKKEEKEQAKQEDKQEDKEAKEESKEESKESEGKEEEKGGDGPSGGSKDAEEESAVDVDHLFTTVRAQIVSFDIAGEHTVYQIEVTLDTSERHDIWTVHSRYVVVHDIWTVHSRYVVVHGIWTVHSRYVVQRVCITIITMPS